MKVRVIVNDNDKIWIYVVFFNLRYECVGFCHKVTISITN